MAQRFGGLNLDEGTPAVTGLIESICGVLKLKLNFRDLCMGRFNLANVGYHGMVYTRAIHLAPKVWGGRMDANKRQPCQI